MVIIMRLVINHVLQCYENVFANNCDECGKIIGIDSKDLSYKEKHWHEACFLCNKVDTVRLVVMDVMTTLEMMMT